MSEYAKTNSYKAKISIQSNLSDIDILDQGKKVAQKAKVRWAIKGDKNTKYFHGILNNKTSQLAIREFTNTLSLEQQEDLERIVSLDKIKRVIRIVVLFLEAISLLSLH
nr:RNA-directed DNA polymerase, eukaryota [Tanacetum cinerariifolium]